jgi:hypothetical protein
MDVVGIRVGAIDSRVFSKALFSTRSDIYYKTLKKTFEEVIQKGWTFEKVIQKVKY